MGVKCAKHYSTLSLKTVFLNPFYRACERNCVEKQIGDPLHKCNDDFGGLTQCVNSTSCHSPLQNLRRSQMHVQRSVDRSVDQKLVSIYTICIKTAVSNNDPLKLDVVKSCAVSQKETSLTRPISLTLKDNPQLSYIIIKLVEIINFSPT